MKFCNRCPRELTRQNRVGEMCKYCAQKELDKLTKPKKDTKA